MESLKWNRNCNFKAEWYIYGMNFYPPITPNNFFHIYNRGNNRENIFTCHQNYIYFLKKYDFYLSGFLDTYAFCLLPNHFHLLVKVKDPCEWEGIVGGKGDFADTDFPSFKNLEGLTLKTQPQRSPEKVISRQFRLFFMSYSKSINKQDGRIGSLFQKNFKRKQVDNNAYLQKVIHYIHANPELHSICKDYKDYPYSSFGRIVTEKPSKLQKEKVLEMFGGKEKYQQFHNITNKENLPALADNEGME